MPFWGGKVSVTNFWSTSVNLSHQNNQTEWWLLNIWRLKSKYVETVQSYQLDWFLLHPLTVSVSKRSGSSKEVVWQNNISVNHFHHFCEINTRVSWFNWIFCFPPALPWILNQIVHDKMAIMKLVAFIMKCPYHGIPECIHSFGWSYRLVWNEAWMQLPCFYFSYSWSLKVPWH